MRGLLKPLSLTPEYAGLERGLAKKYKQQLVYGLSGPRLSYLFAALVETVNPHPVLIVTPGEGEAHDLADELAFFLPGLTVRIFPVWQLPPYQIIAHSKEIAAQRLQVLEGLLQGERAVVIAPAEALLRRLIPVEDFLSPVCKLAIGDRVDLTTLLCRLLAMGYERVELVEERGQFALRGGILDVYPMTAHRPVRLEFFDDELDSMRYFSSTDRKSVV